MKKGLVGLAAVGLLVLGGWGWMKAQEPGKSKAKLVMFKSPSCGCCVGHAAYLKQEGYEVEMRETEEMEEIKKEYGVPKEMESCHTIVAEGYFIEGHVPVETIEKLLREKPEVKGIGLPGMPAGSPGMPGYKKEPFEILSLTKNGVEEWLRI